MGRLEELAFALADSAARSDVECYAVSANTCVNQAWVPDHELEVAVEYLTLRGDALPWRFCREGAVVWFEPRGEVDA